jgi:hypothetical protein
VTLFPDTYLACLSGNFWHPKLFNWQIEHHVITDLAIVLIITSETPILHQQLSAVQRFQYVLLQQLFSSNENQELCIVKKTHRKNVNAHFVGMASNKPNK